jgi:hypothetical protein
MSFSLYRKIDMVTRESIRDIRDGRNLNSHIKPIDIFAGKITRV